jgi:hypothetical protein
MHQGSTLPITQQAEKNMIFTWIFPELKNIIQIKRIAPKIKDDAFSCFTDFFLFSD